MQGVGAGGLIPPGKTQVAIDFLRNIGRDPLEWTPLWSNCFLREVPDDYKKKGCLRPSLTEFSGLAHEINKGMIKI